MTAPALKVVPRKDWARRDGGAVFVNCSGCGNRFGLDHVVHADGEVEPSLVCPEPSCGFHGYVRLEGWAATRRT